MKELVGKFSNPIGCIRMYEESFDSSCAYILRVRVIDVDHNYKRQIMRFEKKEANDIYNSVVKELTEIYEGMQTHAEKIDRILSR